MTLKKINNSLDQNNESSTEVVMPYAGPMPRHAIASALYAHKKAPPLDAMQAHAQALTTSSNCGELFHSEREDRNGYGENIFVCYGGAEHCYTPDGAMKLLCEFSIVGRHTHR